MPHTLTTLFKAIAKKSKRIFRTRSVIIVSDHALDHVPLSGAMQALLLVGVLGFFSGVSYLTGSYMAARNTIREKDRTIVSNTLEKTRTHEEMGQLKHDLVRLSQNNKELSSYGKFVLEQSGGGKPSETGGFAALNAHGAPFGGALLGQGSDKLAQRVAYLETRIQEIRDENDQLIAAIRTRAGKKIDFFEDVIQMTGLEASKLEKLAAANDGASTPEATDGDAQASTNSPEPSDEEASDTAGKPAGANSGGPYIPMRESALTDSDRELLASVDRMVLLHDIIGRLPIAQPVKDAQFTSGFGSRVDPFNGRLAIHPGLDMAGPYNAEVLSTSPGKVVFAGRKAAYGNVIDVDHGFNIVTRYAHLSKLLVKVGDKVEKGQKVGLQGSTGRSTGAHLHYEVRIDNRPVNPIKFLRAGEYVLEN